MLRGSRFTEKLRYKYYNDHSLNEDGKTENIVARPKIEVLFRKTVGPKDPETNPEIRVYALVDSGADICFLPKQIADLLKIELDAKTLKTSKSVSEEFTTYRAKPYLEIFYQKMTIPIGEVETAIPEKYPPSKDIEKMILLGRNSVFSKYAITFNEQAKAMEFRKMHEKHKFFGRRE